MDRSTKWSIAGVAAVILLLFGFCLTFAIQNGGFYREQVQLQNEGTSVMGKAQLDRRFGRDNVTLLYEVGGKQLSAKTTISYYSFRKANNREKDEVCDLEVFYSAADPGRATCALGIATYRSLKTQYIMMSCFFGLFVGAGLFLLIAMLVGDGESKNVSASYYVNGKPVYDLRSEAEKEAESEASTPLPEPLESYANQIVKLFIDYPDMDTREPKLRAIGERMDDNVQQIRVAHRSQYLASAAGIGNMFSLRYLEYAWDGIGGWMK